MWSVKMLPFGYCDQINVDWHVPGQSLMLFVFNRLMVSVQSDHIKQLPLRIQQECPTFSASRQNKGIKHLKDIFSP
jgi:hypothetical protein